MTQPPQADRSADAVLKDGEPGEAGPDGLVLTPMRQLVLDLLRQTFEPIGAYALRDRLERTLGRKVSPPTVYRALDYLQRCGLAARVESCNGWVACEVTDRQHAVLYCVCRSCGTVVQSSGLGARAELLSLADRRGFVAGECTLELSGLCACCRAKSD